MTLLAMYARGSLGRAQDPSMIAPIDSASHDPWATADATTARDPISETALPADLAGTVPLVLLHAFPLDSAMWEATAALLPEIPILLVDLPGAGASPTLPDVAIDAAALALRGSLAELGVERAVIGGASMGGYVAMASLRVAPDLVAGVSLLGTRASADDPEARAGRLDMARRVLDAGGPAPLRDMAPRMLAPTADAGLVRRVREWIEQSTADGVAWAEEAMATRPDYFGTLRAAGVPGEVVQGADDQISSLDQAEAMADALGPETNLVVVTGAGHLVSVEAPRAAAQALGEFYARAVGR
jgi:pimeloyl-ACP methyl ester carboxylesterase